MTGTAAPGVLGATESRQEDRAADPGRARRTIPYWVAVGPEGPLPGTLAPDERDARRAYVQLCLVADGGALADDLDDRLVERIWNVLFPIWGISLRRVRLVELGPDEA